MQHFGSVSDIFPNYVPDGFHYSYRKLAIYNKQTNGQLEKYPLVSTNSEKTSGVSDLWSGNNDMLDSFRDELQCFSSIKF